MTFPAYLVSARLRSPIDLDDDRIQVLHRIRIDAEILHVIGYKDRGINARGTVLYVLRGQEGTVPAEHMAGATVEAAP